jgi:NAD(P)-dependent dehydrogenase (short-subunit alcohol dehydrogenase family)
MQKTAVVVGVGAEEGLGAAVARRFARGGFYVIVGGRTQEKLDAVLASLGPNKGRAVRIDATKEDEVAELFRLAASPGAGLAPASVVVFNAGNNKFIPLQQLSAEHFEDYWRVGCYAGFLVGREAANLLIPQMGGTIIFTGASGSLRGRAGYAHFAAAKAGLRMISQSMAREFGPQGIHVAHVVIDGGINGARLKQLRPDAVAQRGPDGLLNIDSIAEMYWQLYMQEPTAWTQELDLRPYNEPF